MINYIDTPYFSPDERLQSLLKAPPPDAFSNLDTLYHRILSSRPPKNPFRDGDHEHDYYEELVLSILEVIIAWPGGPFSAAQIAAVIKEKVDVVQNIIRGPMRSLFKFDTADTDSPITLCHKSLRDYLLDPNRSKEFSIASSDEDGLFMGVLLRKPPTDRFRCYSRDNLMAVLKALVAAEGRSSISRIAYAVDLDTNIIERVIHGPSKSLFEVEDDMVSFSLPSFLPFLVDTTRAGQFFVSLPLSRRQALGRYSPPVPYRYRESGYTSYIDITQTSTVPTPLQPKSESSSSPNSLYSFWYTYPNDSGGLAEEPVKPDSTVKITGTPTLPTVPGTSP